MAGRKVFLDVGGHVGETLAEVMRPEWGFDRIWTFEPVAECWPVLEAMADDRVTVVPAGWWSEDAEMVLNNPGALNASIEQIAGALTSERCRFIDAASWMAEHIRPDDRVWLKLNIEGAEIGVLERLLDSGALLEVDHLVVHFDIEWAGKYAEAEAMRRRLDASGVSWHEAKRVMFGRTQGAKTASWLSVTEGQPGLWRRRLEHLTRRRIWRTRKWLRRRLGGRASGGSATQPAPEKGSDHGMGAEAPEPPTSAP